MNGKELEGKAALVTGAGSGIGRATALLLARVGARVGLLGRTQSQLDEVRTAITAQGGQADVLVADVAHEGEVQGALSTFVSAAERLDVVFANAGINGVWAPIEQLTPDEWRKTLDVNLNGTFFTAKYSAPHLKKRGGSLVVCASVNGTRMFSNTGATAYACSKAAQVALVKMLAVELGRDKVRVNVVCPGAIETEIGESTERRDIDTVKQPVIYPEGSIPLTEGTPGLPEQVAEVVLFLASDRSSHVNGTEIWIDGGQSLVEG
jgi:NAD(P)-dependent dehydrogenase (short-subunit alcohol dehydrogenase family)